LRVGDQRPETAECHASGPSQGSIPERENCLISQNFIRQSVSPLYRDAGIMPVKITVPLVRKVSFVPRSISRFDTASDACMPNFRASAFRGHFVRREVGRRLGGLITGGRTNCYRASRDRRRIADEGVSYDGGIDWSGICLVASVATLDFSTFIKTEK
jgi:hypothetical protein